MCASIRCRRLPGECLVATPPLRIRIRFPLLFARVLPRFLVISALGILATLLAARVFQRLDIADFA